MSTAISQPRNPSYGGYILRTGSEVSEYELLFGSLFYQKYFRNRRHIVDIGPGRCWFTKQNPQTIVAVDNSPELVEHYLGEGIDIRLGDAYDLPLPDQYADGIFCCWLFEHLTAPLKAMTEIHRVLAPSGYGLVMVPSSHNMNSFYDDYTHVRPYTALSLKQLAEDAGFRNHRESPLFLTFASGRVMRYFGKSAALRYMALSDKVLRHFGLVNRNNLMLEVWKD